MLHTLQQPWYEFLLMCVVVFLIVTVVLLGALAIGIGIIEYFTRDEPLHDNPQPVTHHD